MIGLIALLASAALELAQDGYVPPADARIQVMTFAPDQVVTLPVALGYAAIVELADDERVENIVVGNSGAWQVTPNGRGDRIVVKPLIEGVTTNLIIVSSQRRYVLLLEPGSGAALGSFVLRFDYPAAVAARATASVPIASYRYAGSDRLRPLAMTDDGKRTAITWAPSTALPAVFAIDSDGRETLVNGRMVDRVFMIDGVATSYRFRSGKRRTTATRMVAEVAR